MQYQHGRPTTCQPGETPGGVRPNSGELSEGVGGTLGRLTLFDTATYQELLTTQRQMPSKRNGNFLGGPRKRSIQQNIWLLIPSHS